VRHDTGFIATNIPRNLTNYAQSRIDHALAAFPGRFDTIKVSLGERKDRSSHVTCQLKVRLVPSGIWIIQESSDANPYAAIENAAEAMERSLGRQLARLQNLQPLTSAA
jgi:ribosome-associated translation inhibitor RaiA